MKTTLIAMGLILSPALAFAGGCFGGHAASVVAEAEAEPVVMPETQVASLDCSTLTGAEMAQCLAQMATK